MARQRRVPEGSQMTRKLAAIATALLCAATCLPAVAAAEAATPRPRFLLLVGNDGHAATTAEARAEVVAQYVAWARSLAERGHLVAADELGPTATLLTAADDAGTPREAPAGGFFLIEAADLAEALELSRGCPSLQHGGSVQVAPVVGR